MSALDPALLWALVLLPAVPGGVLALSPRAGAVAPPLAVGTATVTAVVAVAVAMRRPSASIPFLIGTDFALSVDALAALLAPTIAVVTVLTLLVAMSEIESGRARFCGLMLLFSAFALLTATATTLPTLLFAWELMGASSYALIGFWWREEHRVGAGLAAFVTTRGADLGLYLATGCALAGGAGLGLAELTEAAPGWRHVIAAGMLLAALGKAAQLPFSFWLSSAMAGPSSVSALLHSAAMVAMGGYLLLRLEPLLAATGWAGPVAAWAGALTALLLGAVALAQRDLKQLLAASTSAQLGFVVLAAGVGTVSGGATHLVAHASTKALLFLTAGLWLTALGTKTLIGLRGAAWRWPMVGVTASIGALSLAGIAPLSMWATKDEVLASAVEESVALYVVGLGASALSAAYAGKILVVVWRRVAPADADRVRAQYDSERQGTRVVPTFPLAPLVVLAFGAAALGALALGPWGENIRDVLDGPGDVSAGPVELIVSAALALALVLVVWRRGTPEPGWARGWLGLERAAWAVAVTPTLRLAAALARFDDRVLDHGVEALASGTVRAASRAGRIDDRLIDGAVQWVTAQVRHLGALARRPQTGQLHQYYLQSAVVVASGFLLLLIVRG